MGYALYDAKYLKKPVGLNNCGANCWWNSLLQSLWSCPSFVRRLLESGDSGALAQEFIYQMGQGAPSSITLLHKCIIECRKTGKTLDLLSQEGTSNGLIVLLELLNISGIESLFANRYKISFFCDHCNETVSTTEDMSSIITIYKPLPDIDEFTNNIKGHWAPLTGYNCPKCKKIISGPNNRFEKLTMLREILPIVFNKGIITYEGMCLPPRIKFRTYSADPAIVNYMHYELVAQIEHTGHLDTRTYISGGHYFARVLRPGPNGGKVYTTNDTFVDEGVPGPISITGATHMVFYHLMAIGPSF